MISINFPSSAAWNEAILPAIESHSTPKQFSSILDSVATQLTNSSIGPDQVSFSENNNNKNNKNDNKEEEKSSTTKNNTNKEEKQALVNVGARIIIESIMASFVPGTNEETVKSLLLQGGQQSSSSSSSMSSMSISGQPLKSEGHAAAAASVWMKYGKKIVNAQRTRSIEEVCQRVLTTTTTSNSSSSQPKDDDANILRYLSSEVRVCTRSVDESGEDMEVRKDNLFQPMANFAIAAENCDQQQQSQQSAAPVMLQLSTDETYKFLCEVDAIQKKLDELRG